MDLTQPKVIESVSIRKLTDSKLRCDRKRILEYMNNLNYDGNRNVILLMFY